MNGNSFRGWGISFHGRSTVFDGVEALQVDRRFPSSRYIYFYDTNGNFRRYDRTMQRTLSLDENPKPLIPAAELFQKLAERKRERNLK